MLTAAVLYIFTFYTIKIYLANLNKLIKFIPYQFLFFLSSFLLVFQFILLYSCSGIYDPTSAYFFYIIICTFFLYHLNLPPAYAFCHKSSLKPFILTFISIGSSFISCMLPVKNTIPIALKIKTMSMVSLIALFLINVSVTASTITFQYKILYSL
mgnify:CR=1 FL=1